MEVKQKIALASAQNIADEVESLIQFLEVANKIPTDRLPEIKARLKEYKKILAECL